MTSIRYRILISAIFVMILIACLSSTIRAAEPCEEWLGKIVSVQGSVETRKIGETLWIPVHLNDTFCAGDMIRVQENSRAAVVLYNGATLRLDQKSAITFTGVEKKQTLLLRLIEGAAHFFSRVPRSLKLATPYVNGGVEGTEFYVRVEGEQTFLSVFEGKVLATNAFGSLAIASGQSAVAEEGKAPVLRVVVHPRDAVRWALYYPSVIYAPPEKVPVKKDTHDPRFLVYRASSLLSLGRVDEAKTDIDQALKLDPKYSDAVALQSIIAVVQNQKENGLDFAQKAVKLDPKSATAQIVLSYAQQANFNLEGARTSLEEAVKLEPENALAWARLAELYSSFGHIDDALGAAQRAVQLNPDLSRTQTVLGFAYLMQVRTDYSKAAFEEAIKFDQADPLPRLGLGLSKIREGDLQAGGREIEIAASLDPNNSLIRSYLGKVYYEEKRGKIDGEEYAIAKELDPKDPTPWFYDAIAKQTTNRPIEALHDLQKAIELNDNRAVYRSKLMLDSDLAARSSGLGRIYNNLGFQQLGLAEGYKSVNTDPGNFSAHRFLADTYGALPRHEIARTSELLQSQLLQPINITPIQPQLAESNLFLISRQGPSVPSLNTYTPLFNRDQVTLTASGLTGSNETWGGEGIVSGIYKKLSLSAGYTHFETNGFRENNDQDDDIANVFAQMELTHKTSIQAEYRYRDTQTGDLPLRFDSNNFFPTDRYSTETESIRLGLHQAFSPRSHLLVSFIIQNTDDGFLGKDPFFFLDFSTKEDGYMGEIQHLFKSDGFHITSGGGYFDADQEQTDVFFSPPPVVTNTDINSYNLYLYSYINFPKDVTFTIGASADFFKRDKKESDDLDLDEDQFSPKFGVTWNPVPNTTLRGAAFRTFRRRILSNQTLEPTQVAGFNQFFDDAEGADSWRYGIAVDQKFSKSLNGGVEISRRDLEVPYEFFPFPPAGPSIQRTDWEEQLGRAYLYWTPLSWLALSAEYQYEDLERGSDFVGPELFEEIKTHRFPLGIGFFHPCGFSAQLKTTYVDQEGKFGDPYSGFLLGDDQFWVVDAGISYRLPKRLGLITVEAKNLFDETFNFQDTDPANPWVVPERVISAKCTLAF